MRGIKRPVIGKKAPRTETGDEERRVKLGGGNERGVHAQHETAKRNKRSEKGVPETRRKRDYVTLEKGEGKKIAFARRTRRTRI